ncbi:MAG: type II toxin-antitoxin system RelE/ParE family toxin [Chitinophagaceae bacterium]|nr:type II toxin-antitoxin system RelE/ParE family toxin [Chitinophagaceae bacterium]
MKLRIMLLHAAETVNDRTFPDQLCIPSGRSLVNYWAVTVKANWRIIFQFENGNAYLVDYLDCH